MKNKLLSLHNTQIYVEIKYQSSSFNRLWWMVKMTQGLSQNLDHLFGTFETLQRLGRPLR